METAGMRDATCDGGREDEEEGEEREGERGRGDEMRKMGTKEDVKRWAKEAAWVTSCGNRKEEPPGTIAIRTVLQTCAPHENAKRWCGEGDV